MASANFERALALIDAAHALDPTTITPPGSQDPVPYELHYAQQMTHYLSLRSPDASAVLRVAVRGQHFRRWEVCLDFFFGWAGSSMVADEDRVWFILFHL